MKSFRQGLLDIAVTYLSIFCHEEEEDSVAVKDQLIVTPLVIAVTQVAIEKVGQFMSEIFANNEWIDGEN